MRVFRNLRFFSQSCNYSECCSGKVKSRGADGAGFGSRNVSLLFSFYPFFFVFVFSVFRFWLTPISIKVALGIVLWFLKAVARVMWWSFIVNPLCLHFLLCGKFCSLNTTIYAQVIERTADISPLGVNIDERLVFSKHISELRIKASQRAGVLSRLRNLIPTEAKLLLYKSSILSSYVTFL